MRVLIVEDELRMASLIRRGLANAFETRANCSYRTSLKRRLCVGGETLPGLNSHQSMARGGMPASASQ